LSPPGGRSESAQVRGRVPRSAGVRARRPRPGVPPSSAPSPRMSTERDWPVAPVTTSTLSMRRSGRARPANMRHVYASRLATGPGSLHCASDHPTSNPVGFQGETSRPAPPADVLSGPCPIGPAGRLTDEATPPPYGRPRTPGTWPARRPEQGHNTSPHRRRAPSTRRPSSRQQLLLAAAKLGTVSRSNSTHVHRLPAISVSCAAADNRWSRPQRLPDHATLDHASSRRSCGTDCCPNWPRPGSSRPGSQGTLSADARLAARPYRGPPAIDEQVNSVRALPR
jgi:hypothetical protein